jgi:hypothetical protein
LIYDQGCPNVDDARTQLARAFSEAGIPARWQEWDAGDADAPAHVRGYGSPTILIDGRDVAGLTPAEGRSCCRVYQHEGGGLRGVPAVADIVAALDASRGSWCGYWGSQAVPSQR